MDKMIGRKTPYLPQITCMFAVFFILLTVLPVSAQAPSQKPSVADVRKLLDTMEATAQMKKMVPAINGQIWGTIIGKGLGIPDDLRQEISKEMSHQMLAMLPLFLEVIIPIYRRHLTKPEVKAAITFYSSPLGKSIAKKFAQISIESFQAGAVVGRQMGAKAAQIAVQRLRDKGYQL
jgi:hypothetical protein